MPSSKSDVIEVNAYLEIERGDLLAIPQTPYPEGHTVLVIPSDHSSGNSGDSSDSTEQEQHGQTRVSN